MSTTAWILLASLLAALLACVLLGLQLRRSRARAARTEQLVTEARRAVRAAADEEATLQAEQLRVAIARAQADSLSAYVAEERRLSDQRRGELAVRERELSDRMAELVAAVEQRVEERLRAWEADLERAQNALHGFVATLEQRLRQRIADVESRVAAESDELDARSTSNAPPRSGCVRSSRRARATPWPVHSRSCRRTPTTAVARSTS